MRIGFLRQFIHAFHNCVIGMRTGQIGRANKQLERLTALLTDLLERMPRDQQAAISPAVIQMLRAREESDTTSLADILQYELPPLLESTEVDPYFLTPSAFDAIRRIDALGSDATTEQFSDCLGEVYENDPSAKGLAGYAAVRVFQDGRIRKATELLDFESVNGRMGAFSWYLLAMTQARSSALDTAGDSMRTAYAAAETLQDGFVRLARSTKEFDTPQRALSLAQYDEHLHRISPNSQIELAQLYALTDALEDAERQVEIAYQRSASTVDGFARLGWMQAKRLNWSLARRLMSQDERSKRISPKRRIDYAMTRAHFGEHDEAMHIVDSAYNQDRTLQNAYSRLGWNLFQVSFDTERFAELIDRDKVVDRFSDLGELYVAMYWGTVGDIAEAEKCVARYRQAKPAARNQWANIGWIQLKRGNPDSAFRLMKRDFDDQKMSDVWLPSFALSAALAKDEGLKLKVLKKISSSCEVSMNKVILGSVLRPETELTLKDFRDQIGDGTLAEISLQWRYISQATLPV